MAGAIELSRSIILEGNVRAAELVEYVANWKNAEVLEACRKISRKSFEITFRDVPLAKEFANLGYIFRIKGKAVRQRNAACDFKRVYVKDLPPTFPRYVVEHYFAQYGKVLSVRDEYYNGLKINRIKTGVKIVEIILKRNLPNFIRMGDYVARLVYPDMKRVCGNCAMEGHESKHCKTVCCCNCRQPGHSVEQCQKVCSNCSASRHNYLECCRITFARAIASGPPTSKSREKNNSPNLTTIDSAIQFVSKDSDQVKGASAPAALTTQIPVNTVTATVHAKSVRVKDSSACSSQTDQKPVCPVTQPVPDKSVREENSFFKTAELLFNALKQIAEAWDKPSKQETKEYTENFSKLSAASKKWPESQKENGSASNNLPRSKNEGGNASHVLPKGKNENESSSHILPDSRNEHGSASNILLKSRNENEGLSHILPRSRIEHGCVSNNLAKSINEHEAASNILPKSKNRNESSSHILIRSRNEHESASNILLKEGNESGNSNKKKTKSKHRGNVSSAEAHCTKQSAMKELANTINAYSAIISELQEELKRVGLKGGERSSLTSQLNDCFWEHRKARKEYQNQGGDLSLLH